MKKPGSRSAVLLSPAYNDNDYLKAESLGIRAIAAVLETQGAQVDVFDEVSSIDENLSKLISSARLVGIGTLFTRQIPDALRLASKIRAISPTSHVIIGGQGTTFLWKRILEDSPDIDSCCMYEGDDTVRTVWQRILGGENFLEIPGLVVRHDGRVIQPSRTANPIENLDALPFAYRVSASHATHVTMATSRGCAAHCSFCQSGNYGNRYHKLPKWRSRSAANVVQEIVSLANSGVTAISIVDDDFLGGDGRGVDRAVEFCRLLENSRKKITFSIECRVDEITEDVIGILHGVGLRHVLIGIESANEADDRLFAKKITEDQIDRAIQVLRETGVDFSAGFIMFHPLSIPDGLEQNLRYLLLRSIGTYRRVTNRLELYPGAPLSTYYRRKGIDFFEENYRLYYMFSNPIVARYYEAVRSLLRPFVDLENFAEDVRFALDTQHLPGSPARRAALELTRDLSSALVTSALECLDVVGRGSLDELGVLRSRVTRRITEIRSKFVDLNNEEVNQ